MDVACWPSGTRIDSWMGCCWFQREDQLMTAAWWLVVRLVSQAVEGHSDDVEPILVPMSTMTTGWCKCSHYGRPAVSQQFAMQGLRYLDSRIKAATSLGR